MRLVGMFSVRSRSDMISASVGTGAEGTAGRETLRLVVVELPDPCGHPLQVCGTQLFVWWGIVDGSLLQRVESTVCLLWSLHLQGSPYRQRIWGIDQGIHLVGQ